MLNLVPESIIQIPKQGSKMTHKLSFGTAPVLLSKEIFYVFRYALSL